MQDSDIKEGEYFNESELWKPNQPEVSGVLHDDLTKSKEVKKMEEDEVSGQDAEKVKRAEENSSNSEEDQAVEVVDIDPTTLPEVESQYKDLIDYEKYRLEKNVIVSAEVVRLPSKYSNAKDGKQHSLRIIGTVVETVEVEDEKTHVKTSHEFRPSVLIGLVEDKDTGKLLGFPDSEESNWGKLKKTLSITSVKELKGKELPISIKQKSPTASKFLTYMIG